MRSGFSLIELLVVVAIIGILAAVGVVGYQGYIDSTKDEATAANLNSVARALETDFIALKEDIGQGSDLLGANGASAACRVHANAVVDYMNLTKEHVSQFDKSCTLAFNGNKAANSYASSNITSSCPVAKNGSLVKVPRGRLMVACTDNNATVTDSTFKLYTCACVGEDECETEDVVSICGSDANCVSNWMKDNPSGCPAPSAYN